MSEFDVHRRQILTSKVDPRTDLLIAPPDLIMVDYDNFKESQ